MMPHGGGAAQIKRRTIVAINTTGPESPWV